MNGHERRAAATREALKDALLELLCKKPFSEVTIAALCREAKVGRATFYTHYTGLTDIVDEVAEDAIEGTALSTASTPFEGIITLAEKMRDTTDPKALEPYMNLLPICQRVADNPKYRVLFTDDFLSEYILMYIYRHEKDKVIPALTGTYHISEEEADKLFLYNIHGAYAVNRLMNWKKDQAWYDVQKVLLTFQEGGYSTLEKL